MKCKRGHGVAALNSGALTVIYPLFSSWPLPVPSPIAAQGSPQPAKGEGEELKSRGTRGQGAGRPEGGENEGPAGLVSRRRRRRRGDGAAAGSGAVQRHWGHAPSAKRWECTEHPSLYSRVGASQSSGSRQGRSGETRGAETAEGGSRLSWKLSLRATSSSCSGRGSRPRLPSSHPEPYSQGSCGTLEDSVCESWSARLGYKNKLKWCPQSGVARPLPSANPQFQCGSHREAGRVGPCPSGQSQWGRGGHRVGLVWWRFAGSLKG